MLTMEEELIKKIAEKQSEIDKLQSDLDYVAIMTGVDTNV